MLVVGADGLIGRALADRLAGEGFAVVRTAPVPEPGMEVLDLRGTRHPGRPLAASVRPTSAPP